MGTPPAQAQTYTALYTFTGGTDGGAPGAGVVRDSAGNLYGTTTSGGLASSCSGGCGVVFKLDPTGAETVLYSFTGGADGAHPNGLIRDSAGNLYGTTAGGGFVGVGACSGGCGVVFKLDPNGKETVLHRFRGGKTDGAQTESGVMRDRAGNLYGTTHRGGASNWGVVFKLDPAGQETVLYSFTGGTDGGYANSVPVRDSEDNLYGTTESGGTGKPCGMGCGTVFKLDSAGQETVLYSFGGGTDGVGPWVGPQAGVIRDRAGNLYGTAYGSSTFDCCGTVFKLDPTGAETVLHRFTGGMDGGSPQAGLIRDSAGDLYGTTSAGGISKPCIGGCGVVFKLDPTGTETVLYSFTGRTDGANPQARVIRDSAGNLYGTTTHGGLAGGCGGWGCGVVFKLQP